MFKWLVVLVLATVSVAHADSERSPTSIDIEIVCDDVESMISALKAGAQSSDSTITVVQLIADRKCMSVPREKIKKILIGTMRGFPNEGIAITQVDVYSEENPGTPQWAAVPIHDAFNLYEQILPCTQKLQ